MNKLAWIVVATFVTLPFVPACNTLEGDADDDDRHGEAEMSADEEVATTTEGLTLCAPTLPSGDPGFRCAGVFSGRKSSNSCYMFSAARAALANAGVPTSELIQTFGDARASAGTHCPEPGTSQSAATDIAPGDGCGRTRRLRMQGFAAWYRVPPTFGYHIHAVYAGAPVLKQSLRNQVDSFLRGGNGLATERPDGVCPITAAERAAVQRVRNGGNAGGGGTQCFPNGTYCGGNKVSGDPGSLYRCNANGDGAALEMKCANGCSINPEKNDTCK